MAAAFAALPILEGEDPADECSEALEATAIAEGFALLPQDSRKERRLPQGVAHKSAGHTALMRAQKQNWQEKRRREADQHAHSALVENWNAEHALRQGDVILQEPGGTHLRTWQPSGVLRVAWRQLGKHTRLSRGCQGVGETRRPLDCLALTAAAGILSTEQALKEWLSSLQPQCPLHVERHYDPTKLRFKFGRFTGKIHKHASYLVSDGHGGFKKVTAQDAGFDQRRRPPQQGRLEFFVQSLSLHTTSDGGPESRDVMILPCILSKATASATFTAIERSTPEFTAESLNDIAAKHTVVTVSEIADNNGVNRRKKLFTARNSPGNVFYTPGGCITHLLQRAISSSIQEGGFVGVCYSIWLTTRHPRYKDQMNRLGLTN